MAFVADCSSGGVLAERGPARECSILVGHEQSAEPYLGELSDVGVVAASACGLPGSQHDSPAKIRDRQRRLRDGRVANWFAYVGIFIVAAVVFVLWRTRLLP